MKKLLCLIVILFTLQLVYAEQYNLILGQTMDYKGIKIKLSSVGSSESLNLRINNLSRLVTNTNPTEEYGIKISLIDSDYGYQTAVIDITQSATCLIGSDCDDNKPCTRDICQHGFCTHAKDLGCILDDECKDYLTLGDINNVLSYCGMDGDWHPRRVAGEQCFNNAECLSNLCKENLCQSYKEVKMAPSWILIILGALLALEGLFAIKPRLAKRIVKNLASNFSDKSWRIFLLVELIIGIILIIWALA